MQKNMGGSSGTTAVNMLLSNLMDFVKLSFKLYKFQPATTIPKLPITSNTRSLIHSEELLFQLRISFKAILSSSLAIFSFRYRYNCYHIIHGFHLIDQTFKALSFPSVLVSHLVFMQNFKCRNVRCLIECFVTCYIYEDIYCEHIFNSLKRCAVN